jgi:ubiquinone biosynthesis protein COQ9
MEDTPAAPDFEPALIASAFALIAEEGWGRLTVAQAARRANLPLDQARRRFASKLCIVMRFGRLADEAAVTGALTEGPVRDRLFDVIMRRIDALQSNRAGILALFRDLPHHPLTALALSHASYTSMGWMLDAVAVPTTGLRGRLRTKGMLALWLHTVRAWQSDESEDLSATMAALDAGLTRAGQAEATMIDILGEGRNNPA